MVIKTANKSRAKTIKGAIVNWKVGGCEGWKGCVGGGEVGMGNADSQFHGGDTQERRLQFRPDSFLFIIMIEICTAPQSSKLSFSSALSSFSFLLGFAFHVDLCTFRYI